MNVRIPTRHAETAFLYPYIRPIAPKVMDKAAVWVPKGLEAGKKWRSSADRRFGEPVGQLN